VIDALGDGPLLWAWDKPKLQRIARDDYSAQFTLALALKDVHLALETVDPSRFEAFASLAREWERAVDQGFGGEDLTVVTRVLEDGGGMS
jgi:3-hydroxyisobutyrate dehydrogenase